MDDREIIALYFARDEAAILETDRKYGQLCAAVARSILVCEADVEECVNEVYLGAWKAIPPQYPQSFSSFLVKITRNLSLKRLRYHSVFKRCAQTDLSLSELAETIPDTCVGDDAAEKHLLSLIEAFLRKQTPEVRGIFIRKYWFFDTIGEIAAHYGRSEGSVKLILHRTRNRLRVYLKQEGIAL